jgi:hypothetical protein
MSRGEFLTRITIWITTASYAIGAVYLISNRNWQWEKAARLVWTAGCLGLFIHVALALHYFHGWSQASAYRETARQTAEVFGFDWGGGLFINYAVMSAWALDVSWWWLWPENYRRRSRLLTVAWQGFLLFIFFNATVVFVDSPLRWIGTLLCAGLVIFYVFNSPQKPQNL